VDVAKPITSNQHCIGFMRMTDQSGMERLKWIRQELIELKSPAISVVGTSGVKFCPMGGGVR
jgi:hypothetical protein